MLGSGRDGNGGGGAGGGKTCVCSFSSPTGHISQGNDYASNLNEEPGKAHG